MGQSEQQPDEDRRALLALLPADGSGAAMDEIRGRLGWDAGRGRAETVYRDLTAVPPEFRPACGRPGSSVTVCQVPVTVPHARCDLTGVMLSYPGHGGAVVPSPGHGVGNSLGMQVEVDARTLDVTIAVTGLQA